jgi:transcriptional regulator with XRE-family HTH domain
MTLKGMKLMPQDLDIVRLGHQIKQLRQQQGLSLEQLADRSDVSRSMLSAMERGEKAPTIVVLHRVANGLGLTMTRLLDVEREGAVVVTRRDEQVVVRDPAGWERRNLAPATAGSDFEFMRTSIPAGVDAGNYPPHPAGSREFVAVESGSLRLTIGSSVVDLDAGDSVAYDADVQHAFANPSEVDCVYYLAVTVPAKDGGAR